MRAKFVFEKFTEDSDPIHDMGIGINVKRDFESDDDAVDFVISILPAIIHQDTIPEDIIQIPLKVDINTKYTDYVCEYRNKYITVNGRPTSFFYRTLREKLLSMGFKTEIPDVNEKFAEGGDPIQDMGIGYLGKQMNTKAWKILDFIRSKGEDGAGLTEIQHFIWTKLQGGSEKSFWEKEHVCGYNYKTNRSYGTTGRASRGNYCTNLYGSGSYYSRGTPGLLHKYCKKNDKGKWVLVRMPKPREAFYK